MPSPGGYQNAPTITQNNNSTGIGPSGQPQGNGGSFLIPLILAAVGAGSSYLKNRAAGKAAEEQQMLYNQWLQNRQNGVNDLIEQLSGNGFNPFGAQTTTSSGTSLSNSVQNLLSQTSTKPVVTPEYKELEGKFKGVVDSRLNRPTALPPGYIERQVAGINQAFAGTDAAVRNAAARKGLSGAQTFGIAQPGQTARAGKIADFLSTVPLTERDLQNQDVAMAEDLTRTFGLGSESTTKSTGKTTTAGTTNNTLTAPPNLGALASLVLPPGPFAGNQTGVSTIGQTGTDLAGLLALLWSNGAFGGPTRRA